MSGNQRGDATTQRPDVHHESDSSVPNLSSSSLTSKPDEVRYITLSKDTSGIRVDDGVLAALSQTTESVRMVSPELAILTLGRFPMHSA